MRLGFKFICLLLFWGHSFSGALAKNTSYKDTFPGDRTDGCYLLGRGPAVEVPKNPGLSFFLKDLFKDLQEKNWRNLYRYFHPRARVKKDIGDRVEAILGHRYQNPWQFSVFGIWAMVSKEKDKDFYRCEKAKNIRLISHSGYTNQYMLIVQLMGKNELGRLIFSVAPKPDKTLSIVGFHIQQWTHLGEDWLSWTQKGNSSLEKKDHKTAHIYYDIAQKLMDGGTFVVYDLKKDIVTERNKIYAREELVDLIRKELGNINIVYAGTIMSRTDTGMLVRVEIEKEYNAEDLQKKCTVIGQGLLKNKWLEGVNGGVNCNFIPKGSDPNLNSKIGGYYIPRSKLI